MSDFSNVVSPQIVAPTPETRSYRSCLINLGRQLKKDDLNDLKFALRGTVPEGELENLHDPLGIFIALEHRCLLGPDNVNTLRGFLEDIDRPNLMKLLDKYVYETAYSKFALKQRLDSRLDKDGDSCQNRPSNNSPQQCKINVVVDGYEMFSAGCLLLPKQTISIERPIRIAIPQPGPGTSNWQGSGVNEVSPEKTDIKITCVVASDPESQFASLSKFAREVMYYRVKDCYQTEDYYPVSEYPTYDPKKAGSIIKKPDTTITFEALMKETEGLIKDYIGYRLRSRFKQSCLVGIPFEILVPPSQLSSKANILRTLAMNLEARYESVYQRILCLIDLSECAVESTYHHIAKWVFSDEVFNWGRIIRLITVTGVLAHHFVEQKRPEMVCEVTQWLLEFIRVHLMTWMIQNGGWDGFVVFANGYEPSWTEVFAVCGITAAITLLVWVNK